MRVGAWVMNWTELALLGALIWYAILFLPWRPWGTREALDTNGPTPEADLSDITVLIPARNEAGVIVRTLSGLKAQGRHLSVVLVDDRSTDGTAALARAEMGEDLQIVLGQPRPSGWSGKLWALEQGIRHVTTHLTLLMDADIELKPGILPALRNMMREEGPHFVSLMASLRMTSFWERLLMPAFIYFFKLLYPFRLSNSGSRKLAAAAGGCILLETRIVLDLGGFRVLRAELIDDCALARTVKGKGFKTWIGLTHSIKSLRPYDSLATIWNMVARTAYPQLRYSPGLLALCTLLMAAVFWVPIAGLMFPGTGAKALSASALAAMVLTYLPILRFYRLPRRWALAMPLIGTLFLGMTWTSAVRYWKGKGSVWKGRYYPEREGLNLRE
jgi:hopene-associated glycosyltransferase HpnB